MSAVIIPFRKPRRPPNLAPQVPSLPQLVVTLQRKHWGKLTESERDIVRVAEQNLMQGIDRPIDLKGCHILLMKCETKTFLSRVRGWMTKSKRIAK